jgi:hypothetical protein
MNTTLFNSIGLIFDIVGAVLIWRYVPTFWDLNKNGDMMPSDDKEYRCSKRLSQVGLAAVIIGFAFQLLSNIMQLCK